MFSEHCFYYGDMGVWLTCTSMNNNKSNNNNVVSLYLKKNEVNQSWQESSYT